MPLDCNARLRSLLYDYQDIAPPHSESSIGLKSNRQRVGLSGIRCEAFASGDVSKQRWMSQPRERRQLWERYRPPLRNPRYLATAPVPRSSVLTICTRYV